MGDSYINFTIWTRGLQLVLSRVSLGLVIMVLGGGGGSLQAQLSPLTEEDARAQRG